MKQRLFQLIIFQFLFTTLISQDCTYIPLEFDEIEPVWTHRIIDTTFIGHIDTCGDYVQEYTDGVSQVSFNHHSFITEAHLYSITGTRYDADTGGGYLIDKIELETGEVVWQIAADLRTDEYRRQITFAEENMGMLYVYGRKYFRKDDKGDKQTTFSLSRTGYVFRRIYDADTGILLDGFDQTSGKLLVDNDPAQVNESVKLDYKPPFTTYYYPNRIDHFLTARNLLAEERTHNLIGWTLDTLGILISGPDTLVRGQYNGRPNLSAFYPIGGPEFKKTPEGNYLLLEQFSPIDNMAYDYDATLSEYSTEFELIRKIDLAEILPPVFNNLGIENITNNHLIISGEDDSHRLLLILNRDFTLHSLNDYGTYSGTIGYVHRHIIDNQGEAFFLDRNYISQGYSDMELFSSNLSGEIRLQKKLIVSDFNKIADLSEIFLLKNGDFLFRLGHSCYINGLATGKNREWMRFSREDFDLLDAVTETSPELDNIKLHPNPVQTKLTLELPEPFSGDLQLYNVAGQPVLNKSLESMVQIDLDVSGLSAGAYFILMTDAEGQVLRERFVKVE